MRPLPYALIAVALAAVLSATSAAQDLPRPVGDPTLRRAAADGRRDDVPVATSLRQDAQPEQQDRFRPLDELPPEEQYPAAPLIIGAYAFVMAALFVYVLSVARRLGTVKREVDRLERDLKKSGRA